MVDKRLVAGLINDWAEWLRQYESGNPVGYPSSTVEGRAMAGELPSGRPARAIVPRAMMPRAVAEIDRLMRSGLMPEHMTTALRVRYFPPDDDGGVWTHSRQVTLFRRLTGKGPARYSQILDSAIWFVAGRLSWVRCN